MAGILSGEIAGLVSERELWACANHVLATQGDGADEYARVGIEHMAATGDEAGERTWRAILDRMDQLRSVHAARAVH